MASKIQTTPEIISLVNKLNHASKPLVYSRFLNHPQNIQDFPTQSAKDYFKHKKEKYIGCFKANLRFPESAVEQTHIAMDQLAQIMNYSFASANKLSWDDVMIFPILRNVTIISDLVQIPKNILRYTQHLSELTQIRLYQIS